MTLSGRSRLWIVASVLALAGCDQGRSADEAYDKADTAIGAIDQIHRDLREAYSRIDELEGRIDDLESAKDDLEAELERVSRQASNAEGMALSRR